MNEKSTVTIRILKKTHTLLKIIGAMREESMQETLHRLVEQEYQRLQKTHA
jgi:hypothetical protein